MKIELIKVKVRDLVEGYVDDEEHGAWCYGGRLNVRPPYQREFRYDLAKKQAVIETVLKGFPLNSMYWSVAGDGGFEMIDGQQRSLSICEFYWTTAIFLRDKERKTLFFSTLTEEERRAFLDYELTVYQCSGTDKEKLEWFRVINIAGEQLQEQELRNAVYAGPFVNDARRYFSKNGCAAFKTGAKLVKGVAIRQDYLETVLRWISRRDGKSIDEYMALHQHDPNANLLWAYFTQVVTWVGSTFKVYRKYMRGVDWGELYDTYGGAVLDTDALESRIKELMADSDVERKSGIYRYVLTGDERSLSVRNFSDNEKREAYERQGGICPRCGKHFDFGEMEGDHITPWREGGKTAADNCQMLCRTCNRRKGAK